MTMLVQVMTLTNEGGRLKRDRMLCRGRDFELLPEAVWKALSAWYGGTPALPRTVSSYSEFRHLFQMRLVVYTAADCGHI